ncbi:hypothetical protein CSE16_09075 [Solibacillus sp. R5-41]|nr:hypothetical protein CSE16_09075 [Solibacillus sp. R5-41]
MQTVSDIVSLPFLQEEGVVRASDEAIKYKDETIEKLVQFDMLQTQAVVLVESLLQSITEQIQFMVDIFVASVNTNTTSYQGLSCERPESTEIEEEITSEAELQALIEENLKNPIPSDDQITYEGMRKVLGGNGSGTIDGLAPFGILGYTLFNELLGKDLAKMTDLNSTPRESLEATFSLVGPGKLVKGGKKLDNLKDFEKVLETVFEVANDTKKAKEIQKVNQKDIDQLGEYVKSLDKGKGKVAVLKSRKLSSEQIELDWLADKYTAVEVKGTVKVGGKEVDVSRRVYQIEIDKNYVPNNPKALGKSNGKLMEKGNSPYIVKGGVESKVELHHLIQKEPGGMVEIAELTHDKYDSTLHGLVENGKSFRNNPELEKMYNNFRSNYWKMRASE